MGEKRSTLLPPVLAIAFAVVLCSLVLLLSGANPIAALGEMITQVGTGTCLLYTSPSPRDQRGSRMPSSA